MSKCHIIWCIEMLFSIANQKNKKKIDESDNSNYAQQQKVAGLDGCPHLMCVYIYSCSHLYTCANFQR